MPDRSPKGAPIITSPVPRQLNGFQKSVVETREEHERRILAQLEASRPVMQRSLSSDLGIALGLTNLLMRRLVKKGWVRITHVSPRRIRYLITPAGIAAKARLTRGGSGGGVASARLSVGHRRI